MELEKLRPENVDEISDLASTEYGRLDLVEPLYSIAKAIKRGSELANDLLLQFIEAALDCKKTVSLQISAILAQLITLVPIGRLVNAKAEKATIKATPLEATTKAKTSA